MGFFRKVGGKFGGGSGQEGELGGVDEEIAVLREGNIYKVPDTSLGAHLKLVEERGRQRPVRPEPVVGTPSNERSLQQQFDQSRRDSALRQAEGARSRVKGTDRDLGSYSEGGGQLPPLEVAARRYVQEGVFSRGSKDETRGELNRSWRKKEEDYIERSRREGNEPVGVSRPVDVSAESVYAGYDPTKQGSSLTRNSRFEPDA